MSSRSSATRSKRSGTRQTTGPPSPQSALDFKVMQPHGKAAERATSLTRQLFPFNRQQRPEGEVPDRQAVTPPGSATILLVEDEDAIRRVEREFLEMNGFTVLAAKGPGEAIEICRHHPGRIHLLVTDMGMPQMGGGELANRLASERPEMKVLFVSGYAPASSPRSGPSAQPAPFLQKPFSLDALIEMAHTVLQEKRPN